MAKKCILIEPFFHEIIPYMGKYGFKVSKSKYLAKRPTVSGFDSVFFDIDIQAIDCFAVLNTLSIRNDEIQNIKFALNNFYDKESVTIIESIRTILPVYNRMDLEFELRGPGRIVQESNFNAYIKAFKTFMDEVGLDFFNKFSNIQAFDNWINSPVLNGTYNFKTGMNWNNSINGIIASKLAKNPQYEELFHIWIEKLTQKGNETKTLNELNATKEYLEKYY